VSNSISFILLTIQKLNKITPFGFASLPVEGIQLYPRHKRTRSMEDIQHMSAKKLNFGKEVMGSGEQLSGSTDIDGRLKRLEKVAEEKRKLCRLIVVMSSLFRDQKAEEHI
jgi:hypothetical protein